MATYVIGDIQGCFRTLTRLLARIEHDPAEDHLWLAGDLVNRGPDSLAVLRFAKSLGPRLVSVLGNHDLHLVARRLGLRQPGRRDTLDDVLNAPDCDELVEWLVSRPLMHRRGDYALVHAGLLPTWNLDTAQALAREAERGLGSRDERRGVLEALYGSGDDPRRDTIEVFTRLRTCTRKGRPCFDFSGPPADAPRGCHPWFELASVPEAVTLLFGHWAALGLYTEGNFVGLDTGCVWGGTLTAIRLEDREIFQERSELAR